MAKSTSSAAVRSGTSPISRRYMRTGSEVTLVACPASGGRPAARSVNAGGSSSATDTVAHSHLRRDDGRGRRNGVRGSRISSWTPTPVFGDSALVQVRVGADSRLWEGFHLPPDGPWVPLSPENVEQTGDCRRGASESAPRLSLDGQKYGSQGTLGKRLVTPPIWVSVPFGGTY